MAVPTRDSRMLWNEQQQHGGHHHIHRPVTTSATNNNNGNPVVSNGSLLLEKPQDEPVIDDDQFDPFGLQAMSNNMGSNMEKRSDVDQYHHQLWDNQGNNRVESSILLTNPNNYKTSMEDIHYQQQQQQQHLVSHHQYHHHQTGEEELDMQHEMNQSHTASKKNPVHGSSHLHPQYQQQQDHHQQHLPKHQLQQELNQHIRQTPQPRIPPPPQRTHHPQLHEPPQETQHQQEQSIYDDPDMRIQSLDSFDPFGIGQEVTVPSNEKQQQDKHAQPEQQPPAPQKHVQQPAPRERDEETITTTTSWMNQQERGIVSLATEHPHDEQDPLPPYGYPEQDPLQWQQQQQHQLQQQNMQQQGQEQKPPQRLIHPSKLAAQEEVDDHNDFIIRQQHQSSRMGARNQMKNKIQKYQQQQQQQQVPAKNNKNLNSALHHFSNKKKSGASGTSLLPPKLWVKLLVHEEVSSVAMVGREKEGASQVVVDGSIFAQVQSSDAHKNAPFALTVAKPQKLADAVTLPKIHLRPNRKFAEPLADAKEKATLNQQQQEQQDADTDDLDTQQQLVQIPKQEISFVPIAYYSLQDQVQHMPVLLERKVTVQGMACRIAVQVRSKLTNTGDLRDFTIAVAVPAQVDASTVDILRGDGVFDELSRTLKWKLDMLCKGESFMVSAAAMLQTPCQEGQEVKFPVLLRCSAPADAITSVEFEALEAMGFPASVTSQSKRSFRLLHRLK